MAALDPAAFEHCFLARARDLVAAIGGQIVAIDRKTLRRSDDHPHDKERLHKERLHLVIALGERQSPRARPGRPERDVQLGRSHPGRVKTKRLKATWDEAYQLHVLAG